MTIKTIDSLKKVFKDINSIYEYVKKIETQRIEIQYDIDGIVTKINEIEINYNGKSQSELISFTDQLKVDFKNGVTLDELLVPAFAIVREAAKQTLNQRHFDVQLLGGLVLHNGAIAEMKTGEGKTLVSTLPAYLNSLTGKGVHIVTVNDYLAKRDSQEMGEIYKFLGLTSRS